MNYRFFFGAGFGDIIAAHRKDFADEMSVTFSSEFEAFCADNDAEALMVSSFTRTDILIDGKITLENRPKKPAKGAFYHLEEIRYGLGLALAARRFKATHAFLQSGSTYYFVTAAFRALGIKVIPIMHNTLWPAGYPRTTPARKLIRWLDRAFFRYVAEAVIAVSPECARQVRALTGDRCPRVEVFAPQFNEAQFRPVPPKPATAKPLVLTFAGRITEDKGALDLVEIARKASAEVDIMIHICGAGPDLDRLKSMVAAHRLEKIVIVHGRTAPADLRLLLADSHLSIVPTRSSFNEGLAMTVVEAILIGRPVITNPVVPAAEILADACIIAGTDDPASYANEIIKIANDQDRYAQLCSACAPLRSQFFDCDRSSRAAMQRVISRRRSH